MQEKPARIFAYGSNLHVPRMRERAPSAVALCRARLAAHRFVCNKRGRDGSAKANLTPDPDGTVWGVVYELEHEELLTLDGFEGGYERRSVQLLSDQQTRLESQVYISERLIEEPIPYDWYKELIVTGARTHGLPAEYLRFLEALPSRLDPSRH